MAQLTQARNAQTHLLQKRQSAEDLNMQQKREQQRRNLTADQGVQAAACNRGTCSRELPSSVLMKGVCPWYNVIDLAEAQEVVEKFLVHQRRAMLYGPDKPSPLLFQTHQSQICNRLAGVLKIVAQPQVL